VNLIDDICGVGAFHVKINAFLLKKFGQLRQGRDDHNFTLRSWCSKNLARDIGNKRPKVFRDLKLLARGHKAQGDPVWRKAVLRPGRTLETQGNSEKDYERRDCPVNGSMLFHGFSQARFSLLFLPNCVRVRK
jgi:hypothetical protein